MMGLLNFDSTKTVGLKLQMFAQERQDLVSQGKRSVQIKHVDSCKVKHKGRITFGT